MYKVVLLTINIIFVLGMDLLDQQFVRIVSIRMILIWLKRFVEDILTRRVHSPGGLVMKEEI